MHNGSFDLSRVLESVVSFSLELETWLVVRRSSWTTPALSERGNKNGLFP